MRARTMQYYNAPIIYEGAGVFHNGIEIICREGQLADVERNRQVISYVLQPQSPQDQPVQNLKINGNHEDMKTKYYLEANRSVYQ